MTEIYETMVCKILDIRQQRTVISERWKTNCGPYACPNLPPGKRPQAAGHRGATQWNPVDSLGWGDGARVHRDQIGERSPTKWQRGDFWLRFEREIWVGVTKGKKEDSVTILLECAGLKELYIHRRPFRWDCHLFHSVWVLPSRVSLCWGASRKFEASIVENA